ncbi:Uncharacterised protein [Vibrio cholerae]|nr:Uncharacterised protein [Vibrio cholerae]
MAIWMPRFTPLFNRRLSAVVNAAPVCVACMCHKGRKAMHCSINWFP